MAKCPVCGTIGAETGVLCPNQCAYLVRESALEVDAKGLERYLGKLIGERYAVVGYLGRGGMGVVYRARDIKGSGEVAVKVLLNPKPGKRAIRRFLREAKVAVRLRHPNIVSTYGFGRVDEGFFLAMELVDGQPLSRYWRRGVPFDALIAIALQSLSALGAAHAADVIHRDLKPGNVLIGQNERGGLMVKVLDFGLARFLQPDRDTLTRTGELVGTPRYMSPEQARGSRDIDITTDLYALGVILYEFATGKVLFDAEVPTAVAVKHITDPVPPMVPRDGLDLPAGFEAVVRKMLAKDAKSRYPDTMAVRGALAPYLKKERNAELPIAPGGFQNTVEVPPQLAQSVESAKPDGTVHFEPSVIGRKAQLRKLWTLHRQAIDNGRGSVVFVRGEAGIGKSRLLEAFRDGMLESAEMEWYSGETQQSDGQGLSALRRALGALLGLRAQDRDAARRWIHDVLVSWGGEAEEDIDRLTRFFRSDERLDDQRAAFAGSNEDERAQADREQLFGVIERVLRRAASQRPLLMCLEDLHWAGAPTRGFLEYLLPRLKSTPAPLMLVCTMRSDDEDARDWDEVLPRLLRYEADLFHQMELRPLEEDQSRTLVRAMLKATDRLTTAILGMTSGNPLHITQMLRFMHDRQLIVEEDGVWDLPSGSRARELVPPELADLMTARLEHLLARHRLREELTQLVQRAALIGRRVPYRLLLRLLEMEKDAGNARVKALLEHLEEMLDLLLEEGILFEDLDHTEDILTFCHGVLRETLNQGLKDRRSMRGTHLAAAQAKEIYYARTLDGHAAEIAEHYEAARREEDAMHWQMRAADAARRSWNLRACEEHYLRARQLMKRLPGVTPHQRRELYEALGEIYLSTGRHDRASKCFVRAFDAAEEAGEGDAMAHLLFQQGNVWRERGRLKDAEKAYQECLAVSRALGVHEGIGNALLGLSKLARQSGAQPEAHRFLSAAEEQFEQLADNKALADCHRNRAYIYMRQGEWSQGKKHLKESLQINRDRQDRWGLAHVHRDLAKLAVLRGRNDEGQINARKALDLFENIGARYGFAKSVYTLAQVHKAQGHYQAAGDQFQRALAIFEALAADREIAESMFQLGYVALRLGRPREARTWFDRAHHQGTLAGSLFLQGMALAGTAWACAENDDPQSTRAYLQQAHRKLPRDYHHVPDLADIYYACARCFEAHRENALAQACERKSDLILRSLERV